jgi:hypothetical protein
MISATSGTFAFTAREVGRRSDSVRYHAKTHSLGSAMPRSTALGIIEMIARASSVAGLMAPRDIPVQRLPEPPRLDSPATRTETDDEPPSLTSPSGLVLVAANLMPLVGVFYLGWDLANVMVLYWAESAVIGFYTAVKIAVVGRIAAIVAVPFFVGHFGGFMAGHFLLIHSLFVHNGQFSGVEPEPVEAWSRLFAPVGWSLASLFLSHGCRSSRISSGAASTWA